MGTESLGWQPNYGLPAIKDWTAALSAERSSREKTKEAMTTLQETCKADCGKAHITECPGCYTRLIDSLRERYLSPAAGKDTWFLGRDAFLKDLDALLSDARDGKVSLKSVEIRIENEKAAWYRDVLREYPYFLRVVEDPVVGNEFVKVLGGTTPFGALADVVRRGLGGADEKAVDIDEYMTAVHGATEGDVKKAREEIVRLLFEIYKPGEVAETVRSYATKYSEGNDSLDQIMHAIFALQRHEGDRDKTDLPDQPAELRHLEYLGQVRQANKVQAVSKRELNQLRQRLVELQRAKTALKQGKLKAKALAASAQARLPDALYEISGCDVCSEKVDERDLFSCPPCLLLVFLGAGARQTVYCSGDCVQRGQDMHIRRFHPCESQSDCVQLTGEFADGDPSMDVVCDECLGGSGKVTRYCSLGCASANIKTHLEKYHHSESETGKPRLEDNANSADRGSGDVKIDVSRLVTRLDDVVGKRVGDKMAKGVRLEQFGSKP